MDSPQFFSIPETAKMLSISESTLWRYIKSGEVTTHRFGRRVVVPRTYLESLLEGK
jgi:excisionase family DNA binding protein